MSNDIDDYLARKTIYDKPQTVATYRRYLEDFRRVCGDNVTFDVVVVWTEYLRERYSEKTVQFVVGVTKGYLSFCQKNGADIDAQEIRIPRARVNSYEPITAEEYVAMLSHVRADCLQGLRDNVILRTLYDTGARVDEIATIEREGIDLVSRTAEIWTEKTTEKRLIMWGKATNDFLKVYLSVSFGRPFPTKRTIERRVRYYATLAGVKKRIVPHSFRHGKAHRILDTGGTVKDIQVALGHNAPESSFRYLRLNRAERMKRLDKFV